MTDYIQQYRKMHKEPKRFPGWKVCAYKEEIKQLIQDYDAVSLLDYGCGKGWQYLLRRVHEYWEVPIPALYDPGIEAFASEPERIFDGVICVDVLEHIPEDKIGPTLFSLFMYAEKFVFLGISCQPSKKNLPNGEPCHVTVKPLEWWEEQIKAALEVTHIQNKLEIEVRYS